MEIGPMPPTSPGQRHRIEFADPPRAVREETPFVYALKRNAEHGILLAVRYGIVLLLWLGTGYLLWSRVAVTAQQAFNGQLAYQWLTANAPKLEAIFAGQSAKPPQPVPSPSASPTGQKSFR